MKKVKIILWIFLIILIFFLLYVIFLVFQNNNKPNNDTNITTLDILIEKQSWYCYESYYYSEDGTQNKYDAIGIVFKFYDEYIEKCRETKCDKLNYILKDDILTINDNLFEYNYIVNYEEDNLVLEENRDSGTKIVYYFNPSMG